MHSVMESGILELRERQLEEISSLEAVFCKDGEVKIENIEEYRALKEFVEKKRLLELKEVPPLRLKIAIGMGPSRHGVEHPIYLCATLPVCYPEENADICVSGLTIESEQREELERELEREAETMHGAEHVLSLATLAQDIVSRWPTPKSPIEEDDEGAVRVYEDLEDDGKGFEKEIEGIEIWHSEPIVENKSVFVGHLARVTNREQVKMVMEKLMEDKRVARATHNMMAYRIWDEERERWLADNDEDGEKAAGARMSQLLEMMEVKNVVVVVSRWYGGVKLGPKRFQIINNVARDILRKIEF